MSRVIAKAYEVHFTVDEVHDGTWEIAVFVASNFMERKHVDMLDEVGPCLVELAEKMRTEFESVRGGD
jgi:hypothetical protein